MVTRPTFKIAATDRETGQTVYGRTLDTGTFAFRAAPCYTRRRKNHLLGLHSHPLQGQHLDMRAAFTILMELIEHLRGKPSWISEPRIIPA